MVPTESFPPVTPLTAQVTALLLLPLTVAVNCVDALWPTTAACGESEMETSADGVDSDDDDVVFVLLPQAINRPVKASNRLTGNKRVTVLSMIHFLEMGLILPKAPFRGCTQISSPPFVPLANEILMTTFMAKNARKPPLKP
jgi:hypothetical protein